MRLQPIFDTNIFGDVQRGLISEKDWRFLVRHRPGHGWPLSDITAWELLVGVNVVKSNDFPNVRQRIGLAYDLSKGRVLDDPRDLICKELLRIPVPARSRPLDTPRELDVIRRANSLEQLLSNAVSYKGKLIGLVSATSYLDDMTKYKQTWLAQMKGMANAVYPGWEDLFRKTGKRVPSEIGKEYEKRAYWERQRGVFSRGMLQLVGAAATPELVAEFSSRLDAAIEFSIFVTRQFMFHNYSVEKHQSDAADQIQLFYLAIDRFVIVSSDPDILVRTQQSKQAARIMSFDKFLQTL